MLEFFEFIWGVPLVVFIIASGIYLGICTGFFQITRLKKIFKETIFSKNSRAKRVFLNVLGGTVGSGNIIGIATAVAVGGPGAIFWMWVVAFFSMSTKMVEVTLASKFNKQDGDRCVGGPMYYMRKIPGMVGKIMPIIYTIALVLYVLCDAGFAQINTVSTSLVDTFSLSPIIIAIVLIAVSVLILIGELSRISKTLTKMVPIMCGIYLLIAAVVLIMNANKIPSAFGIIFRYAFAPTPVIGGFLGSTVAQSMSKGAARGIFANEAGLGTATTVYSTTKDEPVVQGMWGILEVFFVSFIVCTISGLLVVTTGAWSTGLNGSSMMLNAFCSTIGDFGKYTFCIIIVLISYTTYIGFYYEFNACLSYFFSNKAIKWIRWVYLVPIVFAVFLPVDIIWSIADVAVGFLATINIISLLILSPKFVKELKGYYESRKNNGT